MSKRPIIKSKKDKILMLSNLINLMRVFPTPYRVGGRLYKEYVRAMVRGRTPILTVSKLL